MAVREQMVSDPYRWMEEDTPTLRRWVREEHEHTMAQLSELPARENIRRRLEQLMRAPATGASIQAGKRTFFRQRVDGLELPALYCRDAPQGAARLLFDPNKLSPDRPIALADIHPSPDGSLIAYRLSTSGSSCMPLHLMDVDNGAVLPDVIPGAVNPVAHAWHTRNRIAWLPDNSGFYYTRCPTATNAGEARFNHKLFFHHVGDDWRNDTMTFGESLKREQTPYPVISPDGRYLAIVVQDLSRAKPCSELYVHDRSHPQRGFNPVIPGIDAFIHAAIHLDRLYIRTNHEAPRGKLTAIKLADLDGEESISRAVVPE